MKAEGANQTVKLQPLKKQNNKLNNTKAVSRAERKCEVWQKFSVGSLQTASFINPQL